MASEAKSPARPVIAWHSSERTETAGTLTVHIRAETVGRPAMLIVEHRPLGRSGGEALVRLRMMHWRYGPLGGSVALEPVEVSDRRFARTVFEVDHPRRSTVLAAATEFDDGQGLICQFVVAGVGRVKNLLDQLFDESIHKALEVV